MNRRNFFRIAIQTIRFLLLPFPSALFLMTSALDMTDRFLRPDRIPTGEPGEIIGGIILLMLTAVSQVFMGVPSLLILDALVRRLFGYLAATTFIALFLSALLASMFREPQFGQTFGVMFPWVFLFFGVPLILSYLLAWYLRTLMKVGDASSLRSRSVVPTSIS